MHLNETKKNKNKKIYIAKEEKRKEKKPRVLDFNFGSFSQSFFKTEIIEGPNICRAYFFLAGGGGAVLKING